MLQQYDGDEYEICMSRASSTYSIRELSRLCSINSTTEQENIKKYHQKYYTTQNIFEKIEKQCLALSDLFFIHKDLIYLLFNKYKWNIQNIKVQYFVSQQSQYSKMNSKIKKVTQMDIEKIQLCMICQQSGKIYTNICTHQYCQKCWSDYVKNMVDNQKPFIKCIDENCQQILFFSFIIKISSPQTQRKYIRNLSVDYVKNSKQLTFCPGVGCDYYFEDTSLTAKNVVCICGQRFCFKCGRQPHQPCTCNEVQNWYKLIKKQNINENWIKKHTKICPNCKLAVERSLGCNFINCNCGEKFCYHCSRKWDECHTSHFKCPYQQQKQSLNQTEEKLALKITKNYGNFLFLDSIQKKAAQQLLIIDKWREQFSKKTLINQSDTLFLRKSCELVLIGQNIIKWTEVAQYFKQLSVIDKQIGQFNFKNLKSQLQKYKQQVEEMKKKIMNLVQQEKFLMDNTKGVQRKDFYSQRESIEKKTKVMDKILHQYLQQLQK